MKPVIRLVEMSRNTKWVRFESERGKSPVRLFQDRSRRVSFERVPIPSGMFPWSPVELSSRWTKFGKEEKLNFLNSSPRLTPLF